MYGSGSDAMFVILAPAGYPQSMLSLISSSRDSWEDAATEWEEAKRDIEESDRGSHDAGQETPGKIKKYLGECEYTLSQGNNDWTAKMDQCMWWRSRRARLKVSGWSKVNQKEPAGEQRGLGGKELGALGISGGCW